MNGIILVIVIILNYLDGDWGLGIGDWGLGIGNWGLGIGDCAQSPIPNPQSPIPIPKLNFLLINIIISCKLNNK